MTKRPWNWCHKCRQEVDVDEGSGDGSEHRCWGCRRFLTLVVFTDGTATLESDTQRQRRNREWHKWHSETEAIGPDGDKR